MRSSTEYEIEIVGVKRGVVTLLVAGKKFTLRVGDKIDMTMEVRV